MVIVDAFDDSPDRGVGDELGVANTSMEVENNRECATDEASKEFGEEGLISGEVEVGVDMDDVVVGFE